MRTKRDNTLEASRSIARTLNDEPFLGVSFYESADDSSVWVPGASYTEEEARELAALRTKQLFRRADRVKKDTCYIRCAGKVTVVHEADMTSHRERCPNVRQFPLSERPASRKRAEESGWSVSADGVTSFCPECLA
jgi:hypothetical protein